MSRLSNRKLNKLLQDAIESINVPDVRDKAKKVPINAVPTTTSTVAKKQLPKKRIAVACIAMCCLIVMCTCIGVIVPQQFNKAPVVNDIAYVTVDINPSFTIKLVNGKVQDITNNNKDAGIVLAGIDSKEIIGKDFDTAINRVLEESAITGFIDYGPIKSIQQKRNAVKIGVIGENGLVNDTLATNIENSVKNFFKYKNLYAFVVQDRVIKQANDDTMEKYGITLSKYELIKSVYCVEHKKIIIDKFNDYALDKFVKENKDARVSDLYNRLLGVKSDKIQQIYTNIHNLIAKKDDFEKYVKDNLNIINEDLDNFITTQIETLKEEGIIQFITECDNEAKQYIDNLLDEVGGYKVILDSIDSIIDELRKGPNMNTDEIISELSSISDWLKSLRENNIFNK